MSKPAAAHHALNLLEEDTAVNDTRLSLCAKTLLQHVLHNLAAELVVCELRDGQQERAATMHVVHERVRHAGWCLLA